ncbi:MAG: hypothetical protein ACR2NU_09300 [Aeoliella sp.]
MSTSIIEVVKVGGSLVGQPDFVPALQNWLLDRSRQHSNFHQVLVVGGGPFVAALRQLDAGRPMTDEFTHWKAIELMETIGRVIGHWMPELTVTEEFDTLRRRCDAPGTTLLLATTFLRNIEPSLPGTPLPAGWCVTSDSIAARLAIALNAPILTLLKSVVVDAKAIDGDWRLAVELGLVDEFFPTAIQGLRQVAFDTLPVVVGDRAAPNS